MADVSGQHPACLPDDVLLQDCHVERLRRSGPGGQHRNKVETAVRLTHQPTGIVAEASERRSQSENFRRALRRLRMQLAVKHRTFPATSPTQTWQARCRDGRFEINSEHEEFPALICEALDVLALEAWELSPAAVRLGCNATQLVKLLSREPHALAEANRRREGVGLRPLHPR